MYANKVQNIYELKANIREEIVASTPEMLKNVMENSAKRLKESAIKVYFVFQWVSVDFNDPI